MGDSPGGHETDRPGGREAAERPEAGAGDPDRDAGGGVGTDRRSVLGALAGVVGLPEPGWMGSLLDLGTDADRADGRTDQKVGTGATSDERAEAETTWTARNQEFERILRSSTDDVSDRRNWLGLITSRSALTYEGASYSPGYEHPDDDEEGGWIHSFTMVSYGLGLRQLHLPVRVDTETDLPDGVPDVPNWIPAGTSSALGAFTSDAYVDYTRDENLIEALESLPTPELQLQNTVEFNEEGPTEAFSIAKSTDSVDVFKPEQFLATLGGYSVTQSDTDDPEPPDREALVQSLRGLSALTYDETGSEFSEVTEPAGARVAQLRQQVMEARRENNRTVGATSLILGVVSGVIGVLTIPFSAGTSITLVGVGIGLIGTAYGFLGTKYAESGTASDEDLGFSYEYPISEYPVVGHKVRFRVEIPDGLDSAKLAVKNEYDVSATGDPSPTVGSLNSGWIVEFDHGDEAGTGVAPEVKNVAEPVPPATVDLDPGRDPSRRAIDIDPEEDLSVFRPNASFVVVPGSDSNVLDSESVLTVEPGTEVTFDIGTTEIGHAPIDQYELTLESYSPESGWSETSEGTLIDHASHDGTLFGTTGNKRQTRTMDAPGFYRATLTVRDEDERSHTKHKRLLVADTSEEEPRVGPLQKTRIETDVPDRLRSSDDAFRLKVDASPRGRSGDRSDLAYLWGVALADDDRFDVDTPPTLAHDDQFDADTSSARSRATGGSGDPWTLVETSFKRRRHRAWVLVVDPSTGRSVLRSTEYGSIDPGIRRIDGGLADPGDPDADREIEDVNGDGEVDETDVSALADRIESERGVVPNHDFNDDGTVDGDDVEALFEEVNSG
jgi:hypothetical protein